MLRKLSLIVLFLSLVASTAIAQKKMIGHETPAQKKKRMEWWTDARFGMFIHWGLYSGAARHEWVKHNEAMTNEQYQKYFDQFNPDHFDPHKWARAAKSAGMKYAVLTTKHHEGFCMFDSKYTDYKATNTQAKRDLVKEYVQAFRAEGLKVGFYYSLLDWHHPDYTMDDAHPLTQRDTTQANYDKLNKGRDMAKYRLYLKNQVRELLTNYGKVDVLWLDWSWDKGSKRGKRGADWTEYADGGDFETPEQVSTKELDPYKGRTWETCQTFSGSWGYYRDENSWKTHRQLLDLLITSVSNGGNLILNVGPTARGEFDYRATNALDSLANWMHANSKAIYNCTYAPNTYKVPDGTRLTYNPQIKRMYVHLYNYPADGKLILPGYQGKIKYAQFLNDHSELKYQPAANGDLELTLPKVRPRYEIPVVELTLR